MTGYNPDSWLDLLGLLIIGVAFVAAAAIPAWFVGRKQTAKAEAQRVKVDEVYDQVVNNHGKDGLDRNLRSDIDRLIELGEENRSMISGLHADLREERHERRQGDKTLREDINHRLSQIASRVDMLADG